MDGVDVVKRVGEVVIVVKNAHHVYGMLTPAASPVPLENGVTNAKMTVLKTVFSLLIRVRVTLAQVVAMHVP